MVKLSKSQKFFFSIWLYPKKSQSKSLTVKLSLYVEIFRVSDLVRFFEGGVKFEKNI